MNKSSLGPLAPGPDCDQFAVLLPLLHAGELADEAGAEVRVHLASCRWCQQRLKEYDALETALRRHIASLSAAFPTLAPESVIQMVDREDTLTAPPAPGAEAPRRPRPVRRVVTWMAPLAAVLAIIVVVVAIFVSRSNPTSGMPTPAALYVGDSGHIVALRPSDGKLLWRSTAVGLGLAGTVSDGGMVYGLQLGNDGVSIVALRASDGTTAWESQPIKSLNPTIAAANGVLYYSPSTYQNGQGITYPTPAILAFRGSDGHLLWRHAFDSQNQIMSTPVVANGKVYVGVGTSLAVLRASDGVLLWRIATNLHGLSYLEQLTVTADSVYLYIQEPATSGPNPTSVDVHLAALNANSPGQRWLVDFGGSIELLPESAPVVANGVVYIGASCCVTLSDQSGNVNLYALRAADGHQLWSYQSPPVAASNGAPLVSGPVLANGALYFSTSDGFVSAVRLSDHTLLWQHQPALQGQQFFTGEASILGATDQALFVETSNGVEPSNGVILAMRTSDGGTIWQWSSAG